MRGYLLAAGILALFGAVLVLNFAWSLRDFPVLDHEAEHALQVDKQGNVFQGARQVGRFTLRADGMQVLRLPLIDPRKQRELVTTKYTVTMHPEAVRPNAEVVVRSLQGSDAIQWRWQTDQVGALSMVRALPDAQPVLEIVVAPGIFSLPMTNRVADTISHLPVQFWAVCVGCALLALLAYTSWRLRAVAWKVSGERPLPPGDLRPVELALLHHGTIREEDLAAQLFNLADRGYLQILDRGDDQVLFLRTTKNDDLKEYERNLLLLIFPQDNQAVYLEQVLQGINRELFSAVVSQMYADIYDSFTQRGFFVETPRHIHIRYKTFGIAAQLVGLVVATLGFLFLIDQTPGIVIIGVGCYLAGLILFGVGYKVVPVSRLGRELIDRAAGFRNYLTNEQALPWGSVQESVFYSFIPYALSVNAADAWLHRFRNHTRWEIPDWYTDSNSLVVQPEVFVQQVEAVARYIAQGMGSVKDPNVD